MDLLGDLGATEQLTSARAEIGVLQKKVKELTARVKELGIENEVLKSEKEALKAEVEIYREEATAKSLSNLTLANNNNDATAMDVTPTNDDFVRSGNGVYPSRVLITLNRLHENSNPLCCGMSSDDAVLATAGADSYLSLLQWGPCVDMLYENKNATNNTFLEASNCVKYACRIRCEAPIISCQFSPPSSSKRDTVAIGGMDGSVCLVKYNERTCFGKTIVTPTTDTTAMDDYDEPDVLMIKAGKHQKYVKAIVWSAKDPSLFASCSADGTVNLYQTKTKDVFASPSLLTVEKLETFHLQGPVESICFVDEVLCCYARGTPFLSCFDLAKKDYPQTKIHLNQKQDDITTRASGVIKKKDAFLDDFVSFCVMDMIPSPNTFQKHNNSTATAMDTSTTDAATTTTSSSTYLVLATDTSRQIVLDFKTGKIIRNLYGHDNDSYSQPKIGWSQNGQYILGNTQHDSTVCVWDIASSSIVETLSSSSSAGSSGKTTNKNNDSHPHSQCIRDMYCSPYTNTMVTTSFDKMTKIWVLK